MKSEAVRKMDELGWIISHRNAECIGMGRQDQDFNQPAG